MGAIDVADVHKTFSGGVKALRGVSLEIAPGEIFGLLGRNGAGKTTLVKILLDLVRPSAGTTRLLGVPSRSVRARREAGYLPEDHRFPDYHTGESALRFYGGLMGMSGAQLRARTRDVLGLVDLADVAKRKVRAFSKGMKQRLALAQALLSDPKILFLDEPTDGVDPVGRAKIRGLLDQQKRLGRTIFLNSHLLSEMEQLCDRVAILDQGLLVRCGTIDELTEAGHTFTITTSPPGSGPAAASPPPDVVAEVARLAVSVKATETGLEVALRDDAAIDAVVDLLRARGVGLRGLSGKRHTLEAVFLETVKEPAASVPSAASGASVGRAP
jgi:ABC-2 type transport system ATP-binding protein